MFFATSLLNFAASMMDASTGSSQPDKDVRVERASTQAAARPPTPPPAYDSVTPEQASTVPNGRAQQPIPEGLRAKIALLDYLVIEEDFYKVLGIERKAKPEDVRKAFLNRSRACHPDKFPSYPQSTVAFQKVALAYETLSKPSSRRMYDVLGSNDFDAAFHNGDDDAFGAGMRGFGDETLNDVLYSIMCEFLEGDFEMIRIFIKAMNDNDASVQFGNETIDSMEAAFRSIREMLLTGQRYARVIHLELIRLYEIQQRLRSLSYFDVFGRLRLTLQLARVTLSIPMAIDQAMKTADETEKASAGFQGGRSDSSPPFDRTSRGTEADEDFVFVPEKVEDTPVERRARGRAAKARRRARRAAGRSNRETGPRLLEWSSSSSSSSSTSDTPSSASSKNEAKRPKGLLGPTAGGLLMGIIKMLETSEAWVPGQSGRDMDSQHD